MVDRPRPTTMWKILADAINVGSTTLVLDEVAADHELRDQYGVGLRELIIVTKAPAVPVQTIEGPSDVDLTVFGEGKGDWWTIQFLRLCQKSDRAHLEALRRASPAHVAAYERWQETGGADVDA